MFDKIAAALSVIALGVSGFAVYKTTSVGDVPSGIPEKAIAAYLRENPQAIIASLESYERETRASAARQQAELDVDLIATNKTALLEDGYSHVSGNLDGDVTVVEILDYNCGYCKKAHSEVQALLSSDKNIRYVLKEFPILGPGSTFAARAALASQQQADTTNYSEFSDRLMSHKGTHDETSVIEIATAVGLDPEQLQVDMASPDIDRMLKKNYALAETLNITGTPGFVIGESIVRGYVPASRLQELADAARTKLAVSGSEG